MMKLNRLTALVCTLAIILTLGACSATTTAPAITGIDDLENKTIGVQTGTTGAIYAEDIPGVTLDEYSKGSDAVLALRQGKVDCVIIDDQPAKNFAALNNDIKILEEPFELEEYAMCVSKKTPELTEAMNGAIAELKADGTLQRLMDKYIENIDGAEGYVTPEGTQYPNGTLTMGTNAAFPPYEYWGENNEICGLDADFAKAICDRLGYELVIEDMEFDSILVAIQTGKIDFGAAGMSITEERLQSVDFTTPYCTATQVIIIKK